MLTNEKDVIGDDFVATPGQDLDPQELRLVLGLAEGIPPHEIAQALGTTAPNLRDLETSATRKLGARSRGNLIARAFQTGVLQSRHFAILGAVFVGVFLLAYVFLHSSAPSMAERYDTWAGGSHGAAMQDPRYNGKHPEQM